MARTRASLEVAIFTSGLSQRAIAKKAVIEESKFSKIVNGWRPASTDEQKAIARVPKRPIADPFRPAEPAVPRARRTRPIPTARAAPRPWHAACLHGGRAGTRRQGELAGHFDGRRGDRNGCPAPGLDDGLDSISGDAPRRAADRHGDHCS